MQLDFSPFGDSNYDSETVREPALREPLCTLNVHPNCIVTAKRSERPLICEWAPPNARVTQLPRARSLTVCAAANDVFL